MFRAPPHIRVLPISLNSMARLPLLLLLCCCFLFFVAIVSAEASPGYTVAGKLGLQGLQLKPANVKLVLNGGQLVAFPRPDGYFAFQGVPAGTHRIEVCAPGYFYSPLRVDVSAKLNGQVRVVAVETGRVLAEPMFLEPLKEEQYYEKREPFSLLSLIKSPMGLMVGFMVVAVFLLPKLMDSIDPEEMKKMQEEMANRPAPSFSNLLQQARN